jgi:hypothetical protein
MKKVILALSLVAALAIFGALQLFQFVPTPIANSVIAEKPADGVVGGQVATVLPPNMTTKQHQLLNLAYLVAKENNMKEPELLQAVLLQETNAGALKSYKVANPGKDAYFGPMQIKLAAARDVLGRWPGMYEAFGFHTKTDDEVKANLILNERFNLDVAAKYLNILRTQYGLSGHALLIAYNRGPGGDQEGSTYATSATTKLAMLNRVPARK